MQMSLGHFIGQWLEILRKLSRQKTGVWKSSFLQDPRYARVVGEMCAALLHACRIFIVVVRDIGEGSNYIVYLNPNYSN